VLRVQKRRLGGGEQLGRAAGTRDGDVMQSLQRFLRVIVEQVGEIRGERSGSRG
jgi:hypothetical protein